MAVLTLARDIAAPPNEVFAFFIPQRMPLWYGTEMNACFEVQGGASEFALGQTVRIVGHLQNHTVSLTARVSACEWEKLLEWQFEDSYGVQGSQRWELTPVKPLGARGQSNSNPAPSQPGDAPGTVISSATSSTTRVIMRDSYRPPGLYGRIVDVLLTRFAVSMRDRSWLDRLAHLATRR